jgi:hypothetical protein
MTCLMAYYNRKGTEAISIVLQATHEHIYWDQASVLAQIGLIDTKSLPIMGIEQARKLLEISQKNIQTEKSPVIGTIL